ncbi:hypothetical protein CGRA01v4_06795 [Colletotrichum graminicola]|nr:hypothetical protein CGRA01v4_06795 [Colletotrichum graminicola]
MICLGLAWLGDTTSDSATRTQVQRPSNSRSLANPRGRIPSFSAGQAPSPVEGDGK